MKFNFNIFKGKKIQSPPQTRSFKAAQTNRFTSWMLASFQKIDGDLKNEAPTLIIRSRNLTQNNEIFRSYLHQIRKQVIGENGFVLQSQVKNKNGDLDSKINEELENAWYDFCKRSTRCVSACGMLGARELDNLIVRNFITDGEVFIQILRGANNEYGISFKVLDSLQIDHTYNRTPCAGQNAIVMGIEIDSNERPIKYYFRESASDQYRNGKLIEIPADQIIHLYRKEFACQTRGFSELVAALDSVKQLDDYAIAELMAAKVSACQGIFYEKNGAGSYSDPLTPVSDDQGTFVSELTPGTASIVPAGYQVKSVSPTHPTSVFSDFTKAGERRIAASVGLSYNKLSQDYEAVSYSSLREATIDNNMTWRELQNFFIENWKEIQYGEWLKSYLLTQKTKLTLSNLKSYLNFSFLSHRNGWFDPYKEIIAIKEKLALGLTNPLQVINDLGLDPESILDGWVTWNKMLAKRKLSFASIDKQTGLVDETTSKIITDTASNPDDNTFSQ